MIKHPSNFLREDIDYRIWILQRNFVRNAVLHLPRTSLCILRYVACIYSNIYYTYYTLYTYNQRGEKEREVRETHRRTHTYTAHISQFKTRSSQLIPRTLGTEKGGSGGRGG